MNKRSLALFRQAAQSIPAYNDYLKARNVNPDTIVTSQDWSNVPLTSKKTYLQQYPLKDLLWNGTLEKPLIFCATSGSTGEPFYFPRTDQLSWQYSWLVQKYLSYASGRAAQGPVLVIVAFGMGIWIGGVITLRAFEIAAQRMNYPMSLLPVGYNKTEIFKALRQLSPKFEQTILIGYPPFVKEIIDEAPGEDIDLASLNLRLFFAAESFTETFRDYLCKKTGANPLLDTMNIYGTADIGAMAYETPASILIRRLAVKRPKLFADIFGQIEKTPTLAQYNPAYMEFEEVDGEVVLTGNSALPLIRYSIGDHGGVISFAKMQTIFKRNGLSLNDELQKAGIVQTVDHHPFVFVYERVNFSVILHGINIYPEFIKESLLNPDLLPFLTQKFTMQVKYDSHHDQYLEINLELQKDTHVTPKLRSLTKRLVRQKLIEKSSEFAEISKTSASRKLIKLVFWSNGHTKYFTPGVKQKWSIQNA